MTEQASVTPVEPVTSPVAPEAQWLWAEVVSVDLAARAISAKYLEYETDTEKEIVFSTDEKTTYENIKSLEEIKPQDTISVDYVVAADSKNIATNISLEKAEAAQAVEKIEEVIPEDMAVEAPENTAAENISITE
jgi:hypothetical protein